jgi:thioredoxin-related protein
MHPRKTITIISAIGILLFTYYSMSSSPVVSDEKYTYMAGLDWHSNFEDGQKVAVEQDKPMLVYFWATWCEYCEKMQTEVYPDPRINEILKNDFVLVAVDIDINKEDAQAFGEWTPPAELFVTPEGTTIDRAGGYMPEDRFLGVLRGVKGYYDNIERLQ